MQLVNAKPTLLFIWEKERLAVGSTRLVIRQARHLAARPDEIA
jgi:hypothetical protein